MLVSAGFFLSEGRTGKEYLLNEQMMMMTQKELFPLFPSTCSLDGCVLLLTSRELVRLIGRKMADIRLFLLVRTGCLSLRIDDEFHEMWANAFLDLLEGVQVEFLDFSTDLQAWCLIPNYTFAKESLKNLRPGPDHYLVDRLHFPVLQLNDEQFGRLARQMELFESALTSLGHAYRRELLLVYFKSFMLEVGQIMLERSQTDNRLPPVISKRDWVMMDFMKLVWQHVAVEHQIDFYADKLCISTKHLSRLVKEVLGKTPHEVICDELIKRATERLDDENISVSQIAEELHFSDQAAFCKFFKKHYAVSPMEYRRKLRMEH